MFRRNILIALTVLPLVAFAKGNISGLVKDKSTGDAISFANVQLYDTTGKALPIGVQTDIDGRFTISDVEDGEYYVKVTNMGSVEQERPVKIAGANISLGEIILADDTKMLQEVVVEGIRGQMRFELDKKVFNVDSNIAAAGASASELLESIPSVEVDQDGEVSLRGDSSVTVWINGRESGLSSDNRGQILEQIPAESIEKIEVITNPSAKYSPEGTSGIINIVLKKDRRLGYFGTAEVGGNTRGGANASVNFNLNSGKFDTFASVGYRHRQNTGGSWSERQYDDGAFLTSDGTSRNRRNNVFVRAGVTWHPTTQDDIYLEGFGMFGRAHRNSTVEYDTDRTGSWLTNTNENRTIDNMRGANGEMGWTHTFAPGHTLDVSASFDHWGGPMKETFTSTQHFADEIPDVVNIQDQNMEVKSNDWNVNIDYEVKIADWAKLEAGYEGEFNHEDTPQDTRTGADMDNLVISPALTNRFIYTNNNNALYATFGGKVKDFSFSAGLRSEAWQVRTRSLLYQQTVADVPQFKKSSFALFPSVFLSYSLPHDNEVQINYTRRLRRPWGGQLNSAVDISDPANISFGNPELDPQYSNAFEVNYLKTWTDHMISFSGYLRTSSSLMERVSALDGNVVYTTWQNVGKSANLGAEIVVKNRLFRIWDLTTTVNLYNSHMSAWETTIEFDGKELAASGQKRNSFSWDISSMWSFKLPWGLSLQLTGRYNARRLTAQGSMEPGWNVDGGLRKNLGNWSFSLNCRDIFDSRKFHNFTNGDGYTQESKRWRGGRTLQLTVKYNFGNMNAKNNKRNQNGEPSNGSGYGGEDF